MLSSGRTVAGCGPTGFLVTLPRVKASERPQRLSRSQRMGSFLVRLTLFVAGFALIGLATGIWLVSQDAPTTIVRQTTRALSEGPGGGGFQPGGSVTTVVKEKKTGTVTTTTTKSGPQVVSTTTTGPTHNDRSVAVTLAWLVVGAVLVVAATFFKPALRTHSTKDGRPAAGAGPSDPQRVEPAVEPAVEPVTTSGRGTRPVSIDTF